ncbi:MAG: SDR family NAD(P)-dependent oxidoreductase [Myxococcota bacterium]
MSTHRFLVTGANKGIGLAIVRATLDADRAAHVLLGARDRARGEAAVRALVAEDADRDGRIEVLALDVADDASVAAAAAALDAPLDGLVNNAGIGLGDESLARVLDVNTRGPHRVVAAFLPHLARGGRVVNVSSASGPNFVAGCSPARRAQLTDPDITWALFDALLVECLALAGRGGDFAAAGFGTGAAYGLSKALVNALTLALAREHPELTVNACTPGYIETDLTRPVAEARGASPASLGMKPPAAGARAPVHLLLGDVGASGWYFGSDAQRSPLDRYRAPGDPPFTG